MIICHRYQFIFIKTRKTAGSSVEVALSRLCQEGDIVTPLSVKLGEEYLRQQEGGYGPTGHLKPLFAHKGLKEWRRLLLRGQRSYYCQHMTATEIKDLVGSEIWNNYLKISLERNPWDRALSRYWWQKYRWEARRGSEFPNISDYFRWLEMNKPHWISNWGHYTIDEKPAVDYMLLYERLQSDIEYLANLLGVKREQLKLPRLQAKGGFRKDNKDYTELINDTVRKIIERVCRCEIEYFGYCFTKEGQ